MKLVTEKHIRGANREFNFEHRVKGVKQTFTTSAISYDNAIKKVWTQVSKAYKALKA
jgi:hypothetical protein